ncbi:hypothetical protein [Caulobacter hibisci]|uniref:Uncharacterized protein n=1 Tax=Caulobacter hibisci TaxID=2035993 RepID=A0ABS0SYZ5_9CAUL|nr:hypothetical protein [Caulobacter hibisci]MBI1684845.1 hypothetical protein [Caulobacter hibisci]
MSAYFYLFLALAICGLAFWRGGPSASRIAIVVLGSWAASLVIFRHSRINPDVGLMVVDVLTAVLFMWESVRSRLLWTVAIAAFQLVAVVSHLAALIDLRVTINTYMMSLAVWSYAILLTLALGVWLHWRETRRAALEG